MAQEGSRVSLPDQGWQQIPMAFMRWMPLPRAAHHNYVPCHFGKSLNNTAYSAWEFKQHSLLCPVTSPLRQDKTQLGCSGLQGTNEWNEKVMYHSQSKQLEAGAAPQLKPGLPNAPEVQVLSIFLFSTLRLQLCSVFFSNNYEMAVSVPLC